MTRKCDDCDYEGLNNNRVNHHIWIEHTQFCDNYNFSGTIIFDSHKLLHKDSNKPLSDTQTNVLL